MPRESILPLERVRKKLLTCVYARKIVNMPLITQKSFEIRFLEEDPRKKRKKRTLLGLEDESSFPPVRNS